MLQELVTSVADSYVDSRKRSSMMKPRGSAVVDNDNDNDHVYFNDDDLHKKSMKQPLL